MSKKARLSTLSLVSPNRDLEWDCKFPWPDDCFCQAGESGIVFTPKGSYRTAFFEAFPKAPDTFIRGEGATIGEAEERAWKEYRKYLECPEHEYEPRSYRNGAGICKKCGMFKTNVFEPITKCIICGTATYWSVDKADNWYCESHFDKNPDKIGWL